MFSRCGLRIWRRTCYIPVLGILSSNANSSAIMLLLYLLLTPPFDECFVAFVFAFVVIAVIYDEIEGFWAELAICFNICYSSAANTLCLGASSLRLVFNNLLNRFKSMGVRFYSATRTSLGCRRSYRLYKRLMSTRVRFLNKTAMAVKSVPYCESAV